MLNLRLVHVTPRNQVSTKQKKVLKLPKIYLPLILRKQLPTEQLAALSQSWPFQRAHSQQEKPKKGLSMRFQTADKEIKLIVVRTMGIVLHLKGPCKKMIYGPRNINRRILKLTL